MAYAGLRPEEALALRWADAGATLHVHRADTHGEHTSAKAGRARNVALIGPLADDLAAWRERSEWAEPAGLACPTLGRAGRPATPDVRAISCTSAWRSRAFAPAAARAGLAGVIPYNGRDPSRAFSSTERPPILVGAALGHGDAQTLWRHYAGVFAEAELATRIPIEEGSPGAAGRCARTGLFPRRSHPGQSRPGL